jgi:GH24 family phage-related lysozyme (muramidase)
MALLINDPYGGGQQEVDLGRSRITPRETYSTDPRAIEGQYRQQMAQVNQLTDALANFGGTVGKIEQKQREEELKQTDVLAAQIMGQLNPDMPTGPQVAALTGDKSPLLRAAVNEAIGRQQAFLTAQQWIENMPEGVGDTPEGTQKYFQQKLREEADRVGKDPFYGPAYINALTDSFNKRSAQLSASRTQAMQGIVSQDQRERMVRGGLDAISGATGAVGQSAALLRKFEGFRATPYWDVNANRVGYGSDTITRADGSVVRVSPGMTVTREDAERDLNRRIGEFQNTIVKQIGMDAWGSYSDNVKAALTSIAYNYGSLPNRVVAAAKSGNIESLATAVESLKTDNNGVNQNRRLTEASVIRGGASAPQTQATGTGTGAVSAPLRPDVQAFRETLVAEDERYRAINGDTRYTKNLSADNMVTAAIDVAVQRRDASFLDAVPELIASSPDRKAKLDKARQEITNINWQEYQRKKTMDADRKAEEERKFKNDTTTKFVDTGSVDPDRDSRNPDGTIDFEKRKFLIDLQGTSSIPQERSIAAAENLKQSVFDAATTGKWDDFKDDPVLGPIIAEGKQPTSQQVRDHILNRMDISGPQKADLLKNIEVSMQGGSLMQDPRVKTYYRDNVQSMVDGVMKNDAMAKVIAFKNPTMVADVQRVFNSTVRRKIEEAIETKGTTPTGVELTQILEEAEKKAIARFETIMKYVERGQKAPSEQMQQGNTPQAQPQPATPRGRFVVQPDGTRKFVRE